jgi:GNAT superfamily N-acetyltransferase
MFTTVDSREKGIATAVIRELEAWASEMEYKKCILETGKRQEAAILFYDKKGYQRIPNYGQYIGVENSVCFEKVLRY